VGACLVLGCSAGSPPAGQDSPRVASASAGQSGRLVVAIAGDPHTLIQKLNASSTVRGIEEVERLVHASLTRSRQGQLYPQLAEQVPSLENGLWTLLPDGRMETTWKLRGSLYWHDGTPLAIEDVIFAASIYRDRELPNFRVRAYEFVEQVDAPDPETIRVRWKQPYIEADVLGASGLMPLPRHLLGATYQEDKASLSSHAYFTTEFVGLGPYQLKEFARGSHLVLEAFDRYALGKPKIPIVEVKFIVDPTALIANVLAGSVELNLGRGISYDQALQTRGKWTAGRVETPISSLVQLFPQLLTPAPAVIGNPQFRRALLHGIDREELADHLQGGLVPVAHSFVSPDEPEYRQIETGIVRFDFDSRRAVSLVESLGYSRGSDNFFRDSGGQRLTVEIRATGTDINQKTMFAVQRAWRRIGIEAEALSVHPQIASDLEYRATFPGFNVQRQGGDLNFLRNFHSAQARLPQNRFVGNNNTRYMNPELDALINAYEATIPFDPRMVVARDIVRHITDQVVELPLFFDTTPALVSNRLLHVQGGTGAAWNAHEWELK
jgi:peptide/nickel transport system substrate-binding protein